MITGRGKIIEHEVMDAKRIYQCRDRKMALLNKRLPLVPLIARVSWGIYFHSNLNYLIRTGSTGVAGKRRVKIISCCELHAQPGKVADW